MAGRLTAQGFVDKMQAAADKVRQGPVDQEADPDANWPDETEVSGHAAR